MSLSLRYYLTRNLSGKAVRGRRLSQPPSSCYNKCAETQQANKPDRRRFDHSMTRPISLKKKKYTRGIRRRIYARTLARSSRMRDDCTTKARCTSRVPLARCANPWSLRIRAICASHTRCKLHQASFDFFLFFFLFPRTTAQRRSRFTSLRNGSARRKRGGSDKRGAAKSS